MFFEHKKSEVRWFAASEITVVIPLQIAFRLIYAQRVTSNELTVSRSHHTHTHVCKIVDHLFHDWKPPFLKMAVVYTLLFNSSNIL